MDKPEHQRGEPETAEETARRAARQRRLAALAPPVQHEVNNLLTVLIANLESLKRTAPEGSPAQRQVERVGLATRRMEEVVRAYLSMARRPLPDEAAVDPAATLRALEPLLRLAIGSRLDLTLEAPAEPLPAVRLDRALLDLALLDLARDAAERLARGARLGFTLRPRADGGVELVAGGLPPAPPAAALRALAAAAGGRLAEAEEAGGGVTLRLVLPAAAPEGAGAPGGKALSST